MDKIAKDDHYKNSSLKNFFKNIINGLKKNTKQIVLHLSREKYSLKKRIQNNNSFKGVIPLKF